MYHFLRLAFLRVRLLWYKIYRKFAYVKINHYLCNLILIKPEVMKLQHLILVSLTFCLTGCWTRIWTVVPVQKPATQVIYTTQVTTPAPKYVTTTSLAVNSFNTDPCFYLDLQAVAAAFAESRNVQEFEMLLNSNRYMINNLDLNGDGFIDYLRVIEARKGQYHTFLIQACIAPSLFQDVATLVAERRAHALYVEVIGDPYLYGYNYIVRPTFVNRPPLWDAFGRPTYTTWHSPYHYGHWPQHYHQSKPIYLTHYQAYVETYMHNHHYCHVCEYPSHVFYSDYHHMVKPNSRNDYGKQYPDRSFENRVIRNASSNASNTSIRNAGELRKSTQPRAAQATTTDNKTTARPTTTTPAATRPSSTTSQSTTTRPAATRPTQTTSETTAVRTNNRTSSTAARVSTPSTSVETRVNKSGTARTTVKTITNSSAQRTATTVERSSTSSRNAVSTRNNTSTRATNTQSTRNTTNASSTRR